MSKIKNGEKTRENCTVHNIIVRMDAQENLQHKMHRAPDPRGPRAQEAVGSKIIC